MGRKRTDDGRRVTIGVRVSEQTAADIDAARGDLSRSAWVNAAIRAAIPLRGNPAPGELKRAAASCVSAPRSRQGERGCRHPEARVIKGLCGACGTHVG